ncbi:methyltransferase domain-containing protein [Phenylobacterium sp.]|uniref:class I SAM-dependent methyltransferase n=1 Tax=Phenylobacterium sp. TaxID=1871053 RepID=UPI0030F3DCFD
MGWREQLDRRWYPDHGDRWDIVQYRQEVLSLLKPGMTVLDLGAGRGALPELNFSGLGVTLWGADIDPVVKENANLDRAFVTTPTEFTGVPDQSVDLLISCSVLEHVSEPEALLKEVFRVLKPGGEFLAKTPNKFHYMPLIATLTPIWFHKLYNKWRGREEVDTFPTLYRLNSRKTVQRLAPGAGLHIEKIWTVEGRPEYLRLTAPTYAVGFAYERIVNALDADNWKAVLFFRATRRDPYSS